MKIVVNGVNSAPTKMVAPSAINCPNEQNGCFKWDYAYESKSGVLTLTFKCEIQISQSLKGKELDSVTQHENRHYSDFRSLANALQKSIQQAADQGKNLDMENRMEWFKYDVNEASNRFHRSSDRMPTVMLPPSDSRPNP